jgi:hypothetical protein
VRENDDAGNRGFETPDAGRIRLHGEDVTTVPSRRPVNMVFQQYACPHVDLRQPRLWDEGEAGAAQ